MSHARRAPSPSKLLSRKRRASRPRRLVQAAERLELRAMMAGDFLPFHNYFHAPDVNNDFYVTPLDALLVINQLNAAGSRQLPTVEQMGAFTLGAQGEGDAQASLIDVNGDGYLTPLDALTVINSLNAQEAGPPLVSFKLELVREDGQIMTPDNSPGKVTGAGTIEDPYVYTLNKGDAYGVQVSIRDNRQVTGVGLARPLGIFTSFFDVKFDQTKSDFGFSESQKFTVTSVGGTGTSTMTINVPGLGTTEPIIIRDVRNLDASSPLGQQRRAENLTNITNALNLLWFEARNGRPFDEFTDFPADVFRVALLPNDAELGTVAYGRQEYTVEFRGDFINVDVANMSLTSTGANTVSFEQPVQIISGDYPTIDKTIKTNIEQALNIGDKYGFNEDPQSATGRYYDNYQVLSANQAAIVRAGIFATGDYYLAGDDRTDYQGNNFREIFRPFFVATNATAVGQPTVITLNRPGEPDDPNLDLFSQTTLIGNDPNQQISVPLDLIDFGPEIRIIITSDVTAINDVFTINEDNVPQTSLGATPIVLDVLADNGLGADTNNNGNQALRFVTGLGATGTETSLVVTNGTASGTVNYDTTTRAITFTPAANAYGSVSFQYGLSDLTTGAAKSFATVTININEQNDAPTANADTITVIEDQPFGLSGLLTNDSLAPDASVVGEAKAFSNLALWTQPTNGTITLVGGVPTYTPASNYVGPDSFTYVMNDSRGLTSSATVSVTVTGVNDAPSFTVGADPSVGEDSGAATINGFATAQANASLPGDPAEAGQTFTYTRTSGTNPLFSVQPAIDANGNLTFTPAGNQFGSASVTFQVSDSGTTANGGQNIGNSITFNIVITSVNDNPTFTVPANAPPSNEDAGAQTVTNFANNILLEPTGSPAVPGETGNFVVTNNTNTALFAVAPAISSNGTLTYTAAPNVFGSAVITVRLDDNLGGQSTTQQFTITVNSVNDAPSFAVGTVPAVNEDSGPATVNGFATATANALFPSDPLEAGQTFTYTRTSGTSSLFSVQPAIDANGNLTYTPAPNQFGTANVTFRVSDSGSLAHGGQDTGNSISFDIVVTSVNDNPTFTVPANAPPSNEDAGVQTVTNFATNILLEPAGSPAVGGETGNFVVTNNTNTALFAVAPAISSNGTLTYTAAGNAFGSAVITVRLDDNLGGQSGTQQFTITVNDVNDAPVVAGETISVPDGVDDFVLDVLANDNDSTDGDNTNANLTITAITPSGLPAGVNVTIAADGKTLLVDSPLGTFNVPNATVNYTVTDNRGGSTPGTLTLVFIPNRLPLATDDVVTGLVEDQLTPTIVSNLLDNDRPVDLVNSGELRIIGLSLNANANPAVAGDWLTSVSRPDGTVISIVDLGGGQGTQVSIQPGANAFGTFPFYYRVDDTVNFGLPDYDGPDAGAVAVTITGVNDKPTFTLDANADQSILEDAGPQTVTGLIDAFIPNAGTPGDTFEAGQVPLYIVTTDNDNLFSQLPAIDVNGNLTYTVKPNISGNAEVTVVVNDQAGGDQLSDPQTFNIVVTAVNDEPTFTSGGDRTVLEDSGAASIAWATNINPGQPDESAQILTFNITGNTNTALFAVQPAISSTGLLTFTPAPNAAGEATITVNLSDNGGVLNSGDDTSPTVTFKINITQVNDKPTFTLDANASQSILEDAGPQNVTGLIDAFIPNAGTPGDTFEAGQVPLYIVTTDNDNLFSQLPAIDVNGNLTYTVKPNISGNAEVTVVVNDQAGGDQLSDPQTFNIVVTAVNDEPTFTTGGDRTVLEDSGAASIAWATNINPGQPDESGQILTFNITGNTNTALFTVQPAISSTGLLTFTPAPNAAGEATITVNLSDNGGVLNSGDDTSPTVTFKISITQVNDKPTFTLVGSPNQSVPEDSLQQTVLDFVDTFTPNASAPGDTYEAGQTPAYTVTNDNNSLFTVQPSINADGDLTYTPAANAFGTATVTVTVNDGGGIANGGVAVSDARTFTIELTPENDKPAAVADGPFDVFKTITSSTFNLAGNDTFAPDAFELLTIDPSSLTFTFTPGVGSPGPAGPTSVNSADLSLVIDPNNGQQVLLTNNIQFYGTLDVTYKVRDPGGLVSDNAITVRINVLNFLPGFISGVIWVDSDNDGIVDPGNPPTGAERRLAGVEVYLTGETIFGDDYSLSTTTNANGEYAFRDPSVPDGGIIPGTYTIHTNGVELFSDGKDLIGSVSPGTTVTSTGNNQVQVVMGLSGGTVTGLNFAALGLHSKYINIRDYLANSTTNGSLFGVNLGATGDAHMYWSALYDGWNGYHSLKITVAADLSTATIEAKYGTGVSEQTFTKTLSFSTDYTKIRLQGRDGNNAVIRLVGGAADIFGAGAPQGEPYSAEYAAAADALYGDEAW